MTDEDDPTFVFYRGRLVQIIEWERETVDGVFDYWWIRDFETEEEELACDQEFSKKVSAMEVIAWASK